MRQLAAMFGLVVAIALGGCLGGGESNRTARAGCLSAGEASGPVVESPAVVALLAAIDPRTGAMRGHASRLIRFSLPGGEIEAERNLARDRSRPEIDRAGPLRLDAPSGPRLATTRDGRKVLALIRDGAARDRVAVIDAESLALRCTRPLAQGVRYGGLLLGRSRVYAYGVRRVERGRWDAVVTVSDLRDGALLGTRTLRQSTRGGGSKDWFVYWAALSEDERRLVLSYHGSNTTGADSFRVSPRAGVSHPGLKRGTDSPWTHGAVTAVGGKFISATGTGHLRELDRNGRVTRRLVVEARKTHLMDFAIDRGRRLVYVSSCGRNPAIQRVELAGAGRDTVSSGRFCGTPLAVHADRYLVLDARRVGKLGYPGTRPEGLRLLDLTNPGGGHRIPHSASAGPLDAVVVEPRP